MAKRNKKKEDRQLNLITDPETPFGYVEAYKSLRTNLNFLASTDDAHCLVITSALPQESKSNVAANLAVTLSGDNKRVILVDCDLRKPVLHRYLQLGHSGEGLTNVLTGQTKLEEAIHYMENEKIYLLTAGTVPPNPSELLGTKRMHNLIAALKKHFDYVILDAPPVSVVTDAAVLGGMADGAILVVRSDYAPRDAVRLAKQKLEDVGVKIFGVVLSRYKQTNTHKYSGYSYSYGYGYYKEKQ